MSRAEAGGSDHEAWPFMAPGSMAARWFPSAARDAAVHGLGEGIATPRPVARDHTERPAPSSGAALVSELLLGQGQTHGARPRDLEPLRQLAERGLRETVRSGRHRFARAHKLHCPVSPSPTAARCKDCTRYSALACFAMPTRCRPSRRCWLPPDARRPRGAACGAVDAETDRGCSCVAFAAASALPVLRSRNVIDPPRLDRRRERPVGEVTPSRPVEREPGACAVYDDTEPEGRARRP